VGSLDLIGVELKLGELLPRCGVVENAQGEGREVVVAGGATGQERVRFGNRKAQSFSS
jgi:hypothetical protein